MRVRAQRVLSTALVCSSVTSPLAYGEMVHAQAPTENVNDDNQVISGIVSEAIGRYFNPFTVIEGGLKAEPSFIPQEETYVVQEGDVLGRIAIKYDVSIEQIMIANNLVDSDKLSIGQKLKIPVKTFHRVVEGDTLEAIAKEHDVKVEELLKENEESMVRPEALYVGQTIKIPEKIPEEMMRAFTYKPKEGTVSIASRSSSIASTKGLTSFSWPLDGILTSKFGKRWGSMHKGIDISHTNKKAAIAAAKDGKVITAERKGEFGRLVVIDHGNGVETWYAHLSSILVSVGDSVKAGDIVGKMGNIGNSHGSHLHFEIRVNGDSVNPLKYLP